ncbi:MAG: hypothetical protein HC859_05360 [Bacteroidia bacterium]|nr:hypothetical protein [Bacteroidia bacterium]
MTKALFFICIFASAAAFGQKVEYSLSIPGDTTQRYYITVIPEGMVVGSILLLPGFGELPSQTLVESEIPMRASKAGYITIIPALGDWSFFYIDDDSHEKLRVFIDGIFSKYKLNEDTFFIGGHSFGGTMAMQYTRKAYSEKSLLKRPAGVFALDPPLDIERLYDCMTTTNRPDKNPVSVQEDNYVTNRIRQVFGTDPVSDREFFWKVSPYANTDPAHASLKTLMNVPIRIYNEPDINWYIDNRHIDYRCINAIDSAAMINWLRARGNTKAELVTTSGKGYRKTRNMRHPHSWSIADAGELVAWLGVTSGLRTDEHGV